MRKVIAAINTTIDGFCDHTAGIADVELHQHYTNLLNKSGVILYGKTTYELMLYWQTIIAKPSGEQHMDEFARAIDQIPKIVLSNTLQSVDWKSASLVNKPLEILISELKDQEGADILIGSKSLINQLMKLDLIDEYQLCVHPVILGRGNPLFDEEQGRKILHLTNTKIFHSGAVILYYVKHE